MGNLKEFVLLFRMQHKDDQTMIKQNAMIPVKWKIFIATIASKMKLVSVSKLNVEGIIIKSDKSIENKPLIKNDCFVTGILTMKDENTEEVLLIVKRCPILLAGGTVEVRETIPISYRDKSPFKISELKIYQYFIRKLNMTKFTNIRLRHSYYFLLSND